MTEMNCSRCDWTVSYPSSIDAEWAEEIRKSVLDHAIRTRHKVNNWWANDYVEKTMRERGLSIRWKEEAERGGTK